MTAPTLSAVARAAASAGDVAPPTRVLVVEDSPADADLIADYLEARDAADARMMVGRVDRIAHALDRLAAEPFDAVLLDLSLPDARGLEGLARIVGAVPDVPVVVMTGLADDRLAVAAVQAGAQDYLVKGQDGARVVRRAVRYAIERHRLHRSLATSLASEHAAREAAERSTRGRDEVLGIVSHDLRTPLSTILMATKSLGTPGADVENLTGVIRESGEWALRIIQDLLDVSAIEAGRLTIRGEPMTVQAILATIAAMFEAAAAEAGVTLVVDGSAAPRWVEVDVDRVVQALGNLVGNALKFTPRGGRVTIVVAGEAAELRIRVEDTGVGIASEDLPHLFDRFWQARTTRRGGAGLGLAIAKGIAEGHGGRLDVESVREQGSAFTLVLPDAS